MTTSANDLVVEQFNNAQEAATEAVTQMETFTDALADAVTPVATVDVTWNALEVPDAIVAPDGFDEDGSILAALPTPLDIEQPVLVLDEFDAVAPELVEPDAPEVTIGDAPSAPDLAAISTPSAPTIELPATPTYLSLTTPTIDAIDVHEDFLTGLDTAPTLEILAPTPYSYTPNASYSSSLLTALQGALTTRIAGGTGLATAVETAIWDRMRERATNLAAGDVAQVTRNAQATGFHLPSGAVAAQLREAQRKQLVASLDASREIAIKQADLEQTNMQKSIEQVMSLESKLIDQSLNIEQRRFESARFLAQNAVDIHNARVGYLNALNQAYTAYANAYDAIIKGELAKVEVYKAKIEGEKAKAQTNETLVRQYEAEVRARTALAELYKLQVEGAKLLVEIENLKVTRYGEQIKGYVAGINGQTAKVELFKAQWAGEEAKVGVYRTQAQAFQAITSGRESQSRTAIAWVDMQEKVKTEEYRVWGIRMQSEADRLRSETGLFSAKVTQVNERWGAQIKEYQAQQEYILNGQKMNADIARANSNALLEAAKTGAQTYAQLVGSAWHMVSTSASIQADAGTRVSYTYSNKTNATVDPLVSI